MWNKLKKLHVYNGWLIAFLLITGILLFLPSLRGPLASIRISLKQFHILLGFLSAVILLLYMPFFQEHWKRLKKQKSKRINLITMIAFIIVWIISGIVLTFEKSVPEDLVPFALFVHDLFTWIGLPIIIYHSITRLLWVQKQRQPFVTIRKGNEAGDGERKLPLSRRGFIQWIVGTSLVLIIGPSFYKWVKQLTDDGGTSLQKVVGRSDGNNMNPEPTPLQESNPPIGGGYKGQFRVYTVTEKPIFTEKTWNFTVSGLVDEPLTFTWNDFLKLKRKVQVSDFHCVTGWSVYNVTYEGIPLSTFLAMGGVKERAKYVKLYSGDGVYTDTLSLDQAKMDDVMVAVLMDGKLIPSDFGGPVRLIVPKMYAYKSVKWLVGIELIDYPHLGFWEVRGYDNDAWVQT
ncbi:molybdopterin-dependent oxidoreductase [Bacillus taeanensis]|uniref:Oxidoreductase n=1 Tax=Bacillus taeanensis TaxID=273032 RepID=A0A366XXR9_9BACI|nr:molybdopterin-dependent oxidoreductase [Bacillus taeanensis]RBW70697.1 oxidoreductase [Bacillus taeanensis]